MAERRVLVKAFAAEYRKVRKKQKGVILDQLVETTGYERHYGARLLRSHGRRVRVAPSVILQGDVGYRMRRRRRRIYGEDVKRVLIRLWKLLDYLCGKRLVGALSETIEALEQPGELELTEDLRRQLLSKWGNAYTRVLLGLPTRDCTSGFRAYRSPALAAIEPATTGAEGYAFLTELVRRLSRHGCRVVETPIIFYRSDLHAFTLRLKWSPEGPDGGEGWSLRGDE